MLSRDDFKVCKDGRRYKVVQIILIQHPFSPGAPPSELEKLIESGLTRMQAERRIYEYIIEQMKNEYNSCVRSLKREIDDLERRVARIEG